MTVGLADTASGPGQPHFGSSLLQSSKAVSSTARSYTVPSHTTSGFGVPSQPTIHGFGDSGYKHKVRMLIDAVNALHAAGAPGAKLEVPCIVVCGNQSAGKSSLLERITGIPLPRAKGTCTKCPMEVRLSTIGSQWQCKIKLHIAYDAQHKTLPSAEEKPFYTVSRREDLSRFLSAAQTALLNPSKQPSSFLPKTSAERPSVEGLLEVEGFPLDDSIHRADSEGSTSSEVDDHPVDPGLARDELKFTRNKIVLEVTGAEVDLSLNDLPGIIQTDADGEDGVVQLVHDLVKEGISNERAIIVTTISCKDDMENQQIVRMAQAADPDGKRTIGVLTKPDTIEDSDHEAWVEVLGGRRYPLKLGYYCVRNPNPSELTSNMSMEEAAGREAAFFSSKLEFVRAPAAVQQRYGVTALREALSKELVKLAQRELPKLRKSVDEALAQVNEALRSLPPAPSKDALTQLFHLLSEFGNELKLASKGNGTNMELYNGANEHFKLMAMGIQSRRPATWLNLNATKPEYTTSSSEPAFWIRPGDGTEQVITLEKAQQLVAQYQGSQLPTFAPYKVLDVLVQDSKGKWKEPIDECLQSVAEELTKYTRRLLEELFGRFPVALGCMGNLLGDLHSQCVEETQQCLDRLHYMEKNITHTRNRDSFISSKSKFLDWLTTHLCEGAQSLNGDQQNRVMDALKPVGIPIEASGIDRLRAEAILCKKGLSLELLGMVAGALAYYELSSARMIDNVDIHVKDRLLNSYAARVAELPMSVFKALGNADDTVASADDSSSSTSPLSASPAGCRAPDMSCMHGVTAQVLMAEDNHIELVRQQLQAQSVHLKEVRSILAKS